MSWFAEGLLDELTKTAFNPRVPPIKDLHAIAGGTTPGEKPVSTNFRVQGGAKAMGVVRPPTLSTSGGAASQAKAVRAASGRRDPLAPAITPTV